MGYYKVWVMRRNGPRVFYVIAEDAGYVKEIYESDPGFIAVVSAEMNYTPDVKEIDLAYEKLINTERSKDVQN